MTQDLQFLIVGMGMAVLGCLYGRVWQYANDRDRLRQAEKDLEWFSNEIDRVHLHYWNGGDRSDF